MFRDVVSPFSLVSGFLLQFCWLDASTIDLPYFFVNLIPDGYEKGQVAYVLTISFLITLAPLRIGK